MGKELLVNAFGSMSLWCGSLQDQTTYPYGRDPPAEGPHAIRLV